MSVVLAEEELRKLITEGKLIEGGVPSCAEGLKYDFRLGTWILRGGGGPIDVMTLSESERSGLALMPGELVYVLTAERLNLPGDIKAELTHKRKMSHAGILVNGGFCIDPGYKGKLMFALYNYSSSPFPLVPGKKLIAAQFYKLSPEETPPPRDIEPLEDFPDELVRLMLDYEPSSLDGLKQEVNGLTTQLENLRSEFRSKQDWFDRFQSFLDQQGQQIKGLAQALEKETQNREAAEKEFRKTLQDIQIRTTATAATVAIIAAIAVSVIAGFILKALGAV